MFLREMQQMRRYIFQFKFATLFSYLENSNIYLSFNPFQLKVWKHSICNGQQKIGCNLNKSQAYLDWQFSWVFPLCRGSLILCWSPPSVSLKQVRLWIWIFSTLLWFFFSFRLLFFFENRFWSDISTFRKDLSISYFYFDSFDSFDSSISPPFSFSGGVEQRLFQLKSVSGQINLDKIYLSKFLPNGSHTIEGPLFYVQRLPNLGSLMLYTPTGGWT